MNLPNRLTLARVIMVPVFVAFMAVENPVCYAIAYVIFVVASITDYYDGKIARERNLVTNFGKLVDPVADKVLIAAAYIMLIPMPDLRVPAWGIIIIIAREFLVTGARSLAASEGNVVAANMWGKTKAVMQMVYIFVFIPLVILKHVLARWVPDYVDPYGTVLYISSYWAMVFIAVFTAWSGVQFARMNWRQFNIGEL
jgi:CDP-diacylglycerol---glycerol-3-phosphate 3-phosphatidyltransferase